MMPAFDLVTIAENIYAELEAWIKIIPVEGHRD
jgi:hypothetical protein